MKNLLMAFIVLAVGVAANAAPLLRVDDSGGHLNKVKVKRCSLDGKKCFELLATSGEVGQMSQGIINLKNIELQKSSIGKSEVLRAVKGYLDLSSDNLVLIEKNDGVLTETVIKLSDMVEQRYVYR